MAAVQINFTMRVLTIRKAMAWHNQKEFQSQVEQSYFNEPKRLSRCNTKLSVLY